MHSKERRDKHMNFAVLTPTRQRPGKLDNFISSVHGLAANKDRVYTFNYIDSDDPRQKAYEDYLRKQPANNHNCTGEPQSVSKSWNVLAEAAIERGADVLIMGNDDLMYRTERWDELLEEEIKKYPDDIYVMWFEDLINGESHCAFPIVSKTWYETVGYFTPGIFNFGYNDTWIFDLGQRVGRTHFIPNIVNEHLHFTTGKSAADETTKRNRTDERGNLYEKDKVIFNSSESKQKRAAIALGLLEMMDSKYERAAAGLSVYDHEKIYDWG